MNEALNINNMIRQFWMHDMCATEYFWNGKSLIVLCNNARIILWTCGIRPKRLRIAGARESKLYLNNIMYGRMKAVNIVRKDLHNIMY